MIKNYMVDIVRVNSGSEDFRKLIALLDLELNERNDIEQAKYDKYNLIDQLDIVVIARIDNNAVGCGCFKKYDEATVEIKRMFVKNENRGMGIATSILKELEAWANESGYIRAVLETGKKQVEAISLYRKLGYYEIENYGQYIDIENSVCFAKNLTEA